MGKPWETLGRKAIGVKVFLNYTSQLPKSHKLFVIIFDRIILLSLRRFFIARL
jgi:hypothetical protein